MKAKLFVTILAFVALQPFTWPPEPKTTKGTTICKTNPSTPGCPEFCRENPNSPFCQ